MFLRNVESPSSTATTASPDAPFEPAEGRARACSGIRGSDSFAGVLITHRARGPPIRRMFGTDAARADEWLHSRAPYPQKDNRLRRITHGGVAGDVRRYERETPPTRLRRRVGAAGVRPCAAGADTASCRSLAARLMPWSQLLLLCATAATTAPLSNAVLRAVRAAKKR